MGLELIALSFDAIALMRVAQKVTAKKVSREVQGRNFFSLWWILQFIICIILVDYAFYCGI